MQLTDNKNKKEPIAIKINQEKIFDKTKIVKPVLYPSNKSTVQINNQNQSHVTL